MINDTPHVSIIILNWNGWHDTIECLESVLKQDYENYAIILIDNHSTDDSLDRIRDWAEGKSEDQIESKYSELVMPLVDKPLKIIDIDLMNLRNTSSNDENSKIYLLRNKENSGFAIANNIGMEIAQKVFNSDYYYLLNNDTVIGKNALTSLVNSMSDNEIQVAQSTLYSYEEKKIVNAGGRILPWGQTKYYKHIARDEVRTVSSVSGCALLVRSLLISEFGNLTERFFHGEEDFEFSMRMRKFSQKMVCVGGSDIYHKVGTTIKKMMQKYERRTFLFALNRLINLKDYYPSLIWKGWRYLALTYFAYLFWIKNKVPFRRSMFLLKKIYYYSTRLDDVSKSTLDNVYKQMNFAS